MNKILKNEFGDIHVNSLFELRFKELSIDNHTIIILYTNNVSHHIHRIESRTFTNYYENSKN